MRAPLARAMLLLIPAAAACGGGSSPPVEPDPQVLTTVAVIPDTATLFTIAPGTSVKLRAVARDQNGLEMGDVGPAQFSSGDEAVATAGSDGTIAAVSVGTAIITATMTAGEISRSGSATVTVRVPPPAAAVEAPNFRFLPALVDVAAGGVVSWIMGEHFHDVVFSTQGAPENIQPSRLVTVSRTFPTTGSFGYRCLIHSGMTGMVRVH
jgi:plastocyanin